MSQCSVSENLWKAFTVRCVLTHWGRVTHICVGNLTIIGPDNGLSPGRRQAITGTNAGKWLIGPLGTNFSEILIEIPRFSSKKMRLKVSSAIWRPSCLGLNVLICPQRCQLTVFYTVTVGAGTSASAVIMSLYAGGRLLEVNIKNTRQRFKKSFYNTFYDQKT